MAGRGVSGESRAILVLLEEEARADAKARRLLAKTQAALASENARLLGTEETLVGRFGDLREAVSLTHSQHRMTMQDIARLEEEACVYRDLAWEEQ